MQDTDSESSSSSNLFSISGISNNPSRRTHYEAPTFDDDRPWGAAKRFKDPAYGDCVKKPS